MLKEIKVLQKELAKNKRHGSLVTLCLKNYKNIKIINKDLQEIKSKLAEEGYIKDDWCNLCKHKYINKNNYPCYLCDKTKNMWEKDLNI